MSNSLELRAGIDPPFSSSASVSDPGRMAVPATPLTTFSVAPAARPGSIDCTSVAPA
jgi:hypothetical protein